MERAEEKLRAANLLLKNNMFSEAISEAYYAMFHAAKALLALRDIYPKTHAVSFRSSDCNLLRKDLLRNYMRKVKFGKSGSVKRQIMTYMSHPKKKPKILSKMRRNF